MVRGEHCARWSGIHKSVAWMAKEVSYSLGVEEIWIQPHRLCRDEFMTAPCCVQPNDLWACWRCWCCRGAQEPARSESPRRELTSNGGYHAEQRVQQHLGAKILCTSIGLTVAQARPWQVLGLGLVRCGVNE